MAKEVELKTGKATTHAAFSKKRFAKFVLKRLAINASICTAGFVSPFAATFVSRALPALSSTILSSSLAESLSKTVKNINISKSVSDFFGRLFSEKSANTVAGRSISSS